ncbi:exodeoxyribonuclease VII small subunit [candidate division FCPU426 bacterium]|nr:exodeoxyribonuclease VII small subunit [candidate division FCPU426 bacterium]
MPKKKAQAAGKGKAKGQSTLSFEKALEKLEHIVSQLEGAEAPLEKALALYEEGVGLARYCSGQLKAAERKVELLEDKENGLRGRPFADDTGSRVSTANFEKGGNGDEEEGKEGEEDCEEGEEGGQEGEEDHEEGKEDDQEGEEGGQEGEEDSPEGEEGSQEGEKGRDQKTLF